MNELPRTPVALLALMTIAGAALRLHGLDGGLWFDEIWLLVDLIRLPAGELLTTYGSDNNHPLYTWSAWLSVRAFGEQPWALRLPSFVFGVASIPALWFLGRRVTTQRESLIACALLALSYHGVWFSQNARGYAALLFFSITATTYLLRVLEGEKRAWVGHALLLALATWTHQTAVFLAATHFLVGLSRQKTRGAAFRAMLLAPAVSLTLHAPILGEMIAFLKPGAGHEIVASEWTSPLWMIRAAAASFGLPAAPAYGAAVLGLSVVAVGAWSLGRRDRRLPMLFLGPCLLGAVTMMALQRNLWPRFFFFAAGFLLLVGVRSAVILVPWAMARRALVVLALATFAAHGFTAGLYPKQDFAGAKAWIEANTTASDTVVTVSMATFVYESYHRTGWRSATTVKELETAIAGADSAYIVTTMPGYLTSRQPDIAAWLDTHANEVATFPGTVGGGHLTILKNSNTESE